MRNAYANLTRKADKYGDMHLVSLLGATLARLAYFDDNKFIDKYCAVMGSVFTPAMMTATDCGRVIRKNAVIGVAPRSAAASNSVLSCFSRFAYSGRIKNGRYE